MLIMLALFDYLARMLDQFAGLKLAEALIRCTTANSLDSSLPERSTYMTTKPNRKRRGHHCSLWAVSCP